MGVKEEETQMTIDSFPAFYDLVDDDMRYTCETLDIMQVNIGLKCNLACKHCHVQAGPKRSELMSKETMQACLKVLDDHGFRSLDITGGAPEMNPDYEWFVEEAATRDITVMTRSNLVIYDNPEYAHLPNKLAGLGVTIIASLPHYTKKQAERQRGEGTFDPIIKHLRMLNELGYGKEGGPELDLVYNPAGAFLPPNQTALEADYKRELKEHFDITFNNLFAIANNPIGRFGDFLNRSGNLNRYMTKLITAFNPKTLPNMMCRNQLSVRYDGVLFDCDFNQAADIPCTTGLTIQDMAQDSKIPLKRAIAFGNHCYACCAGAGSSCGGATA